MRQDRCTCRILVKTGVHFLFRSRHENETRCSDDCPGFMVVEGSTNGAVFADVEFCAGCEAIGKPPVLAYSAHGLAQCASSANNQERPRRKRSLERAFIPWVKSFRSPPPSRSVKQRMIEAAIPCQSRRRTRHQCRSRLHAARVECAHVINPLFASEQ